MVLEGLKAYHPHFQRVAVEEAVVEDRQEVQPGQVLAPAGLLLLLLLHGWLAAVSAEDPVVGRAAVNRGLPRLVEAVAAVGAEDPGGMVVEAGLRHEPCWSHAEAVPGVSEVAPGLCQGGTRARVFPPEKRLEMLAETNGELENAAAQGFSWGLLLNINSI